MLSEWFVVCFGVGFVRVCFSQLAETAGISSLCNNTNEISFSCVICTDSNKKILLIALEHHKGQAEHTSSASTSSHPLTLLPEKLPLLRIVF